MAITIVLTNQKGGVGKTTTTGALAAGLSAMNKKVLAVDLDPQGNLGFSLGLDIETGATLYHVLKGESPVRDAIRPTEYCDIITSNILLAEAEVTFQGKERFLLLKNVLKEVEQEYDYIVVDTPPSLNILTLNGYAAADYLIIPMAAEILSLVGLVQLKDTVDAVKNSVNAELIVLGILLTKFNRRTNLAKDVLEMAQAVAQQADTRVFNTQIRAGVAVAEAPAHGVTVFDYAPGSNPAKDYKQFVGEVIGRIGA